jgi:hypothetical protein
VPEFGEPAHIVFNFPVRADPNPPLGKPVAGSAVQLTRRAALAGLAATGAALAIAGCTPKQPTSAAQLIAGDAFGPVYTETEQLIRQYDAALTSAPALVALLGPLREEHRQHLIALASLIGLAMPAVSTGPNPSGVPLPPPHPTAGGSSAATPPTSPTPGADVPATPTGASGATGIAGIPGTAATAGTGGAAGSAPPASGSGIPSSPGGPSPGSASVSGPGSPSSGSPAPTPAVIKARLSTAEKTAQTNAVAACIAVAADRVPIIAAIAACRATHIAALR